VIAAETEADAIRDRVPDVSVHPYVELRPVASAALPDGAVQFTPEAVETLTALLADGHITHLSVDGLGAVFPPVAQFTDLLPADGLELSDGSSLLWRLRLVKSDWEVARLREACSVLDRAFAALVPELRPGLTEREIHGRLAAAVFREGADRLGYMNVVAGVGRGLFGAPTDRVWQPGDVLYVDGGAVLDGYWADFCRMYVVGPPTSAQAEGYARCVRGLEAACERLSVPRETSAGDLATTIAQAAGLDPSDTGFGRFGHGIGLYMPEPPSVHPDDPTPLAPGTVLCIEPAVDHHGANYVIEEQYLVGPGGLERLSPPAPRQLIEV
jgi:Xaa-Pro aminopeptidase